MAFHASMTSILCVDDNKYMQQIYWILLSSLGFRKVRFALDGGEALELMLTNSFDLIFSDINATPINGIEFAKFVRSSKGSTRADVPFIIVSGSSEIRNVEAARDAGVTEFMSKPISAQVLAHRIKCVVESPRDFLKERNFVGPDRRRRPHAIFDGRDRRGVA